MFWPQLLEVSQEHCNNFTETRKERVFYFFYLKMNAQKKFCFPRAQYGKWFQPISTHEVTYLFYIQARTIENDTLHSLMKTLEELKENSEVYASPSYRQGRPYIRTFGFFKLPHFSASGFASTKPGHFYFVNVYKSDEM